jgi:hypothetical protein
MFCLQKISGQAGNVRCELQHLVAQKCGDCNASYCFGAYHSVAQPLGCNGCTGV